MYTTRLKFLAADPEVPDSIPGATRFSERGPLSLMITIEELLGRYSSESGVEIREYGRGDPLR
jgi:hypothetical protein